MCTQALSAAEPTARPAAHGLENAERAACFQARIDAEDRIEPND